MTPDSEPDSPPTRQTTWFGFSPALVIGLVALAVALGGWVLSQRGQADGAYGAELRSLCARVQADADERSRQGDGPSANSSIFKDVGDAAQYRLDRLLLMEPSKGHADDHAALIAQERRVIEQARALLAEEGSGRASTESTRTISAAADASKARYIELGVPGGCLL